MLDDPLAKPDAALVCTPNHTHVAVSKELLQAGIHVLCEKPISIDVESGRELVLLPSTCIWRAG
jgi:predicted dehydrogenase